MDVAKFNVDGTGNNLYDSKRDQMRDQVVIAAHKYDWKILWAPMAAPNGYVPKFDLSDARAKAAILKVYQYNINRFGAYIDIWELMNENGGVKVVPREFYDAAAEYIRANDPYQHPITTSYEPSQPHPLLAMSAPHICFNCTKLQLDGELAAATREVKSKLPNQPVLWGETGNRCPVPDRDPENERYRILLWTSFFNEAFIVPWNSPGIKKPCTKGLTNLFVGDLQRRHALAFAKFIAGFDPAARKTEAVVMPPSEIRGYLLGSGRELGGYLVHTTGHAEPISTAHIEIRIPRRGMRGEWIQPDTGAVLEAFKPGAGAQTLSVPAFVTDIAVRIR